MGALEPQFWRAFTDLLGVPDLPSRDDPGQWPELRRRLAAIIATRTLAQWTEVFEGSDACVAPVLTPTESAAHPHLAARGTYVEHAGVLQSAPAPRFSRTPAALGTPPHLPGADTDQALRAWGVEAPDRPATADPQEPS